jgi:hypothetical protein
VLLVSKGIAKVEKAGPIRVLTIADIRAGRSADDLQPVDDSRALVFTIRDGRLVLASTDNLPGKAYVKGQEEQLSGTWKARKQR